jgi:hypothetical protein
LGGGGAEEQLEPEEMIETDTAKGKAALGNNYHTKPRNTPEDSRFHQHRGGSLKSNLVVVYDDKILKVYLYKMYTRTGDIVETLRNDSVVF